MKLITPIRLLFIVLIISLSVSLGRVLPASAQEGGTAEVGVEVGGTQAGYGDALQRPTGLSGYVDVAVNERFAIRVAASHHTENRSILRSPCSGLVRPGRDCSDRRFDGDASLTSFGFGVAYLLTSPDATWQPELYALGTAVDVDVEFNARNSDDRLRPIMPDGATVGLAFGGAVNYAVSPVIAFTGRLGIRTPWFQACGADAWFPFCESHAMPELALGLRIRPFALRQ